MGNVGGELPTALLRVLYVGNVHSQDHQTDDVIAGGNAAQKKLVGSPLPLRLQLAVALTKGSVHRGGHVGLSVNGTEGPSQGGFVRAEERLGRRIQAQHCSAAVQQHQTLVHMEGDLLKFVIFLL